LESSRFKPSKVVWIGGCQGGSDSESNSGNHTIDKRPAPTARKIEKPNCQGGVFVRKRLTIEQYSSGKINLILCNRTAQKLRPGDRTHPHWRIRSQPRTKFQSSDELRTSARIRKPVSRWIIAAGVLVVTMMRGARRGPYEPTPALWRMSDSMSLANDPAL